MRGSEAAEQVRSVPIAAPLGLQQRPEAVAPTRLKICTLRPRSSIASIEPTQAAVWSADYFDEGNAKCHKGKMFFQSTADAWPAKATNDADVFKGKMTARP